MVELFREYLPAFLIAVLIGAIVGYLLFRPKQRIRLSDSTPLRPHMAETDFRRTSLLQHEAGVTTSHVLGTEPAAKRANDQAMHDDLQHLKGVGPKLAEMLRSLGFTRFDQLAQLTETEVERLDSQLGAFRGRIQRDRIVEQADYLARGDAHGFEQRFGKL